MAFIADYVFDAALTKLDTEANRVDICSQEPTTYTEATTTYTLGNYTGISIGAPGNRGAGGREVVQASFANTAGSVTGTGTATHWAISDTGNSRLLATGALSPTRAVVNGDTFGLAAIAIGIPDAA
jgi:hypothetical protein